ncbi:AzlD domain-containing protein [Larsenimonas suaedae]|uniref:AzlD domain-containing protein n=1 Tax=Larsenimonas suaedae TaxID=1851019 RepID=A0ABU1GRD9_9GAMM|nr:AzlD domain-containing protein [Larsenimonas suaedae]MCM2972614.1 AzlD domain-containing protein [Larsenimonas suaedae]MDR5894590.1 AzlD domain-containing protein [Larsenimonas suaedae]
MTTPTLLGAIVVTALGTWAMRALPLLWMQRRRDSSADPTGATPPIWLVRLGPLLIAGLLGTSLVPTSLDAAHLVPVALGLAATIVCWAWVRGLGWPIMAGVAAFALTHVVMMS